MCNVSFAGLGLGLGTAGLDYKTGYAHNLHHVFPRLKAHVGDSSAPLCLSRDLPTGSQSIDRRMRRAD